ncbi:hypothetical protein J3R30DRAFT_2881495 [Lentinula aciculospora]|uniref:Hydrophobin n=1 Tax=Lentinula aciculospora TaxID=153920 RepID=A0A9W9DMT0_9AGAR|nr:hypothetical protein J3R30DRAFT_2881495 [Lentinula aciculospora]
MCLFYSFVTMNFTCLVLFLAVVVSGSTIPTGDSILPCAICPPIVIDGLPCILDSTSEVLLGLNLQCDYTDLLGSTTFSCSYLVSTISIPRYRLLTNDHG